MTVCKQLTRFFTLFFLSYSAHAVTLGDATVFSHLNEPLYAEISLRGINRFEVPDIELTLGSEKQFQRLDMTYSEDLKSLSFLPVKRGDGWYIQVHTMLPLKRPSLSFPLQLKWANGQIIRGYTFVFDAADRSENLVIDTPIFDVNLNDITVNPSEPAAPINNEPVEAETALPQEYGPVQSGETLWPIADKLRSPEMTVEQMAIALLHANPEAFTDLNINKLKTKSTLKVPSKEDIMSLTARQARNEFYTQVKQWNDEKQKIAEAKAQAIADALAKEQAEAQAREEAIAKAKAEEEAAELARIQAEEQAAAEAAAAEAERQRLAAEEQALRIVPQPVEDPQTEQELKDEALRTLEEVESNRIETANLQAKVSELDSELADVQRLVTLKDQQLANLQTLVEESKRELELSRQEALKAIKAAPTNAIKRYIEEQQAAQDARRPAWQKWLDSEFGIRVSNEDAWRIISILAFILIVILVILLLFKNSEDDYDDDDKSESKAPNNDDYTAKSNQSSGQANTDKNAVNVQSWASELHKEPDLAREKQTPESREAQIDASANKLSMSTDPSKTTKSISDALDQKVGSPSSESDIDRDLDLAETYISLGDIDGARELLNKVKNKTNDTKYITRIDDMLKGL